eukprot:1889098-Karenia_brevis.AAC.1
MDAPYPGSKICPDCGGTAGFFLTSGVDAFDLTNLQAQGYITDSDDEDNGGNIIAADVPTKTIEHQLEEHDPAPPQDGHDRIHYFLDNFSDPDSHFLTSRITETEEEMKRRATIWV